MLFFEWNLFVAFLPSYNFIVLIFSERIRNCQYNVYIMISKGRKRGGKVVNIWFPVNFNMKPYQFLQLGKDS